MSKEFKYQIWAHICRILLQIHPITPPVTFSADIDTDRIYPRMNTLFQYLRYNPCSGQALDRAMQCEYLPNSPTKSYMQTVPQHLAKKIYARIIKNGQ